jgi:hypothetical protein
VYGTGDTKSADFLVCNSNMLEAATALAELGVDKTLDVYLGLDENHRDTKYGLQRIEIMFKEGVCKFKLSSSAKSARKGS